jgi:uncharacterized membrane protein YsdA (DUF1294 family)
MPSIVILKFAFTWYAVMSIALFALYGLDKAQARIEGRRLPEKILHLLAAAGGFPGGLLGRALFHHKTRKPTFLIILLVSAGVHGLLWLVFLLN